MDSIFDLFPKNHFGESFEKVLDNAIKGESVAIYGMCGIGMQYAFQFIEKILREEYNFKYIIKIKGGMLGSNPLISIEKRIKEEFKIKSVESFIRSMSDQKIFILIDGLEKYTIEQKVHLLDYLDTLRKVSPGIVVNIVGLDMLMVTQEKDLLRKHSATFSSIYRLDLFDLEGTRRIIQANNKVYEWNIAQDNIPKIYNLSGGNPRLIKYISKTVFEYGSDLLNDVERIIKTELLSYKLETFVNIIFKLDLEDLKFLGIIDTDNNLFSPILDVAVSNYQIPNVDLIGKNLSKREGQIVSLLYFNKNRVVKREKIDYILQLNDQNYSLWASYKALNRLRKKLNKNFELKTIRDVGYSLIMK